jgi:hypothetical protein
MLRYYRRKAPYREDSVILRLLGASNNLSEQTFPHACKQPVGFCGKMDGS